MSKRSKSAAHIKGEVDATRKQALTCLWTSADESPRYNELSLLSLMNEELFGIDLDIRFKLSRTL